MIGPCWQRSPGCSKSWCCHCRGGGEGLQDTALWGEHAMVLRVAQATRVLWKSRLEVRKFRGFLELASARALRLPSVVSRAFRTEVRIEFLECAGMEKCTRMVLSMSTKV